MLDHNCDLRIACARIFVIEMLTRRIIPLVATLALVAGAVIFYLSGEKQTNVLSNPITQFPENTTSIAFVADPSSTIAKLKSLDSPFSETNGLLLLSKVFADSAVLSFNPSCAIFSTQQGFVLSLGTNPSIPSESLLKSWFPNIEKVDGNWRTEDLFIQLTEDGIFFNHGTNEIKLNSQLSKSDSLILNALNLSGKSDFRIATLKDSGGGLQELLYASHTLASDVHLTANGVASETVLLGKSILQNELNGIPNNWVKLIPDKVSMFEGIGFLSGADASTAVIGDLNKADFNSKLADLENQYNTSADDALYVWWNAGIANYTVKNTQITMLGSADQLLTASAFMKLPNAVATSSNVGLIITWSNGELLNHLLSPFVKGNFSAALINEDVVLLAQNESDLNLITAISTLSTEHVLFKAFEKAEHYALFETSNQSNASLLSPWFSSNRYCVSGKSSNGHFFSSIQHVNDQQLASSSTHVSWELAFANDAINSPTIVPDHKNGGYYIVVQDNQNILHAISQQGTEVWSKEINNPIIGSITPIDLYKNGKWQVAFATKNQVHCIDIQGRDVKGFPVSSNQPISSPLFVADYDDNRNYRLLAGCENGSVLNIQGEGIKTAGWQQKPVNSPIILMEHLKVGNKDFLFAVSENGNCYLLNRDGTSRYDTRALIKTPLSCPNFRLTGDISTSSVIYLDSIGQVYESVFGKPGTLPNESILPGVQQLVLTDLDNDRLQEFVVGRSNAVEYYRSDGSKVMSHETNASSCSDMSTYQFDSRQYIGYANSSKDEIDLIDQNGNQRTGFPLKGGGKFTIRDIDNDNQLELITVSRAKVLLCYDL